MCRSVTSKVFWVSLFLICTVAVAQKSREQLEKEKTETAKQIQEAQRILQQTERKKESSLGQLAAVKNQISVRQSLIADIQQEIRLLNTEMDELDLIVMSMESDLQTMRIEYSAMIYSAYKSRNWVDKFTFIFSAQTFQQMWLRYQYMEQYATMRREQAEQVEAVTAALRSQRESLTKKKNEKSKLLAQQISEKEQLDQLENKQERLLASLQKKEAQLRAELEKRRNAMRRLDRLIEDVIRREVEAAARRAASEEAKREASAASASFASQRSRLAWPVSSGFIAQKFGEQPHPVLKRVTINNLGVGIQTSEGESVKSVYGGTVTAIARVPNLNNVVIIQHGEYRTVYANLETINVKQGDVVAGQEVIGRVHTNSDGISELEFQVWKGNQKQNPEYWLSNK